MAKYGKNGQIWQKMAKIWPKIIKKAKYGQKMIKIAKKANKFGFFGSSSHISWPIFLIRVSN